MEDTEASDDVPEASAMTDNLDHYNCSTEHLRRSAAAPDVDEGRATDQLGHELEARLPILGEELQLEQLENVQVAIKVYDLLSIFAGLFVWIWVALFACTEHLFYS